MRDTPIELVAIGRQVIADPDSTTKILTVKSNEMILCEKCMICFTTIGCGEPMDCSVSANLR